MASSGRSGPREKIPLKYLHGNLEWPGAQRIIKMNNRERRAEERGKGSPVEESSDGCSRINCLRGLHYEDLYGRHTDVRAKNFLRSDLLRGQTERRAAASRSTHIHTRAHGACLLYFRFFLRSLVSAQPLGVTRAPKNSSQETTPVKFRVSRPPFHRQKAKEGPRSLFASLECKSDGTLAAPIAAAHTALRGYSG